MSWYLMYLRLPLWHVFFHNLAFDCYVLECPVHGDQVERNVVFHVNAVFDVLHSFSDGIFLLHPLIELSLILSLVILFPLVR